MKIIFNEVNGCDEVYMDCLKSICGDTEEKSMVDLCSNLRPHTPKLGFKERSYVDIIHREVEDGEQHNFVQANVLVHLQIINKVDVAIASDAIEHLTEDQGLFLLKWMQIKSDKMVLFTPLGDYMVDTVSSDPEGHHSGWTPEKLESIISDHFAYVVIPNYHPTLNIGAFFFWWTKDIKSDFQRVLNELKEKSWAKDLLVQ